MPDNVSEAAHIAEGGVRGFLHVPTSDPVASLALTHGAGGNCTSTFLVDVAEKFAAIGVVVLRFDLAFRQTKPSGPPHPSKAAADRESVRDAVDFLRGRAYTPLWVGGHSYGGRQASMAVAESAGVADGLVTLSYPLHPPGKPEKSRTAHLPAITVPSLFVAGSKDPFGTPEELIAAIATIPGPTEYVQITGAGHDMSPAKFRAADRTVDSARAFFGVASPA